MLGCNFRLPIHQTIMRSVLPIGFQAQRLIIEVS